MVPRPKQVGMMMKRLHEEEETTAEAKPPAAAAAAKPTTEEDEALYETLLRYQDDADFESIRTTDSKSLNSEEDCKLPAKPTPGPPAFRQAGASFKPNTTNFPYNDAQEPPISITTRNSSSPPVTPSLTHKRSLTPFYQAALDAASTPDKYPDPIVAGDEKLAQELSRRLELEEQAEAARLAREQEKAAAWLALEQVAFQPECLVEDSQVADREQLRIMEAIRREAEQRQLERALQESSVCSSSRRRAIADDFGITSISPPAGAAAPPEVDFLLSQKLALEECQQVPRRPPARESISPTQPAPQQPQRRFSSGSMRPAAKMEHYIAPDASTLPEVQKGSQETREAIANGTSHVVQCQGCGGRLHAPISYDLVYCPKCHTVSPGQTFVASDDRASLRRGRSKGGL